MARFIKIGGDIINVDAITKVSLIENQSGMSDRLVIHIGEAVVTVDSLAGKERMTRVHQKLLSSLSVEDWDV